MSNDGWLSWINNLNESTRHVALASYRLMKYGDFTTESQLFISQLSHQLAASSRHYLFDRFNLFHFLRIHFVVDSCVEKTKQKLENCFGLFLIIYVFLSWNGKNLIKHNAISLPCSRFLEAGDNILCETFCKKSEWV